MINGKLMFTQKREAHQLTFQQRELIVHYETVQSGE